MIIALGQSAFRSESSVVTKEVKEMRAENKNLKLALQEVNDSLHNLNGGFK